MKDTLDFEKELTDLLNRHSVESDSNTPDFILARYLCGCLLAWTVNTNKRDDWRSMDKAPSETETKRTAKLKGGRVKANE